MEGMVNDLQLAREKHATFAEWKAERQKTLPYDMVVSVLTTGFWPSYKVFLHTPFTGKLQKAYLESSHGVNEGVRHQKYIIC